MNSVRFFNFSLLLVAALTCNNSTADPQSKSFSTWRLGLETTGIYTIMAREVTRLSTHQNNVVLSKVLLEHLTENIAVTANGLNCPIQQIYELPAIEGYIKIKLNYKCPHQSTKIKIANRALFNVAASHIHFAKFAITENSSSEYLFTRRQLSHEFSLVDNSLLIEKDGFNVFLTYIQFGFEHILIGLDHIAFLLTLVLLASKLKDIIFIITGFTIGHSITLSLTVLGLATPNIMVVEAFIGFSIAIIAAENINVTAGNNRIIPTTAGLFVGLAAILSLFAGIGPSALSLFGLTLFSYSYLSLSNSVQRARKLRPGITTLFGLIHGFGFASVLIEVGLPEQALVPALLGFNMGVELGQIAIVALLSILGWIVMQNLKEYRALLTELLSASLCGLGIYWFIQRLYF
tara:strand:+ start:353 stop:1567 length:1215 start_codon:yes stop_codon:yes gene_type:complete